MLFWTVPLAVLLLFITGGCWTAVPHQVEEAIQLLSISRDEGNVAALTTRDLVERLTAKQKGEDEETNVIESALKSVQKVEDAVANIVSSTTTVVMARRCGYLLDYGPEEWNRLVSLDESPLLDLATRMPANGGDSRLCPEEKELRTRLASLRVLEDLQKFSGSDLRGCLGPEGEALESGMALGQGMAEGFLFKKTLLALQSIADQCQDHQIGEGARSCPLSVYREELMGPLQQHLSLYKDRLAAVVGRVGNLEPTSPELGALVVPLHFEIANLPTSGPLRSYLGKLLGERKLLQLQKDIEQVRLLEIQLGQVREAAQGPAMEEVQEYISLARTITEIIGPQLDALAQRLAAPAPARVRSREVKDNVILVNEAMQLATQAHPYFRAGFFVEPQEFVEFFDNLLFVLQEFERKRWGAKVTGKLNNVLGVDGKVQWKRIPDCDSISSALLNALKARERVEERLDLIKDAHFAVKLAAISSRAIAQGDCEETFIKAATTIAQQVANLLGDLLRELRNAFCWQRLAPEGTASSLGSLLGETTQLATCINKQMDVLRASAISTPPPPEWDAVMTFQGQIAEMTLALDRIHRAEYGVGHPRNGDSNSQGETTSVSGEQDVGMPV